MKSKLIPFSIVIIIVILSFALCGRADYLKAPDKIVVYTKGNSKEIDKSSPEFNEIVKLTEKRFHRNLSTAQDIVDYETIGRAMRDGIGIEFIYSEEQEMSMNRNGFRPFKYYKLFFQLTSEKSGTQQGSMAYTLQYAGESGYEGSSRGPLRYSEKLVKLVERLK